MKRRNFLKGIGVLMGMAYVNPVALIPDIVVKGNTFMTPNAVAAEALSLMEDSLVNYTLGRGELYLLKEGEKDLKIGNAPSITFTIEGR